VLKDRLLAVGVEADRAREVAIEFLCAVEGAFLLCRTTRSTQPLAVVGRAMSAVVSAATVSRSFGHV
jgi:hypothetical protein